MHFFLLSVIFFHSQCGHFLSAAQSNLELPNVIKLCTVLISWLRQHASQKTLQIAAEKVYPTSEHSNSGRHAEKTTVSCWVLCDIGGRKSISSGLVRPIMPFSQVVTEYTVHANRKWNGAFACSMPWIHNALNTQYSHVIKYRIQPSRSKGECKCMMTLML